MTDGLFASLHCRGTDWLNITGGEIDTPDCGGIDVPGYSSQAAFFSEKGLRSLTTKPLDLEQAK